MLSAAGIGVERHDAHFATDTPDDVWIAEVARRGWVGVSHNRRIRYMPNEVRAVFDSGLALLILVGQARTADLATNFVRTIDRIERFVASHRPPYIAKVFRPAPADVQRNPAAAGRIEM